MDVRLINFSLFSLNKNIEKFINKFSTMNNLGRELVSSLIDRIDIFERNLVAIPLTLDDGLRLNIFQNNDKIIEIENLTYENLLKMIDNEEIEPDCYIVDKEFRRTFVYTHETEHEEKTLEIINNKHNIKFNPYYIGPFFKSLDDN